jgi:hypothetical protein
VGSVVLLTLENLATTAGAPDILRAGGFSVLIVLSEWAFPAWRLFENFRIVTDNPTIRRGHDQARSVGSEISVNIQLSDCLTVDGTVTESEAGPPDVLTTTVGGSVF